MNLRNSQVTVLFIVMALVVSCSKPNSSLSESNATGILTENASHKFTLLKTYEPLQFPGIRSPLCFSGMVSPRESKYAYYVSCDNRRMGTYVVNTETNAIAASLGSDDLGVSVSAGGDFFIKYSWFASTYVIYELALGPYGRHWLSCDAGLSDHPDGFGGSKLLCLNINQEKYSVRVIQYSSHGLNMNLASYDIDSGRVIGGNDKYFYFRPTQNPDAITIRDIDTGKTVKTIDSGVSADKSIMAFFRYVLSEEAGEFNVTDLETGRRCHLNYSYRRNFSLYISDPLRQSPQAYAHMIKMDETTNKERIFMVDLNNCETVGSIGTNELAPDSYTMRDKTYVSTRNFPRLEIKTFDGRILDSLDTMVTNSDFLFTNGHKFLIRQKDNKTLLYSF